MGALSVARKNRKVIAVALVVILAASMMLTSINRAWADESLGEPDASTVATQGVQIYDPQVQFEYDSNNEGTNSRVVVWFKLTGALDLSDQAGSTEIAVDYFIVSGNDPGASIAQKNKYLEGYLNSYPGGTGWKDTGGVAPLEYSNGPSGSGNVDVVPADTEIATSTSNPVGSLFGQAVSADTVMAATIRVTDAGGSSDWATVYSDGRDPSAGSAVLVDDALGVSVEYDTAAFPAGLHMHVEQVTIGQEYDAAAVAFDGYEGFVAYNFFFTLPNIYHETNPAHLQTKGLVDVLVPLPYVSSYENLEYAAYDCEQGVFLPGGFRAPYYGSLQASHFSSYALGWRAISDPAVSALSTTDLSATCISPTSVSAANPSAANPSATRIPATNDNLADLTAIVFLVAFAGSLACAISINYMRQTRKHTR